MPKMFPATYYKNMINYWIPSPYNPEHRYPSIRFPWILSLDYVSEVADETAQGEYLNRCAREGICKVNIFTDLYLAAMKSADEADAKDYRSLRTALQKGMNDCLKHYFKVFETK